MGRTLIIVLLCFVPAANASRVNKHLAAELDQDTQADGEAFVQAFNVADGDTVATRDKVDDAEILQASNAAKGKTGATHDQADDAEISQALNAADGESVATHNQAKSEKTVMKEEDTNAQQYRSFSGTASFGKLVELAQHYRYTLLQGQNVDSLILRSLEEGANDQWLTEANEPKFRIMSDAGVEVDGTRDMTNLTGWQQSSRGSLIVPYGPRAAKHFMRTFGLEERLLTIADDKAALLKILGDEGDATEDGKATKIRRLEYSAAFRVVSHDDGKSYILEKTEIPQMWWHVAQNLIVPAMVLTMVELDATGTITTLLADPERWGSVGHIAWVFTKKDGANLETDEMTFACLATDGGKDGWKSVTDHNMAKVLQDPERMLAIADKWLARKKKLIKDGLVPVDFQTKDENVVIKAGLRS